MKIYRHYLLIVKWEMIRCALVPTVKNIYKYIMHSTHKTAAPVINQLINEHLKAVISGQEIAMSSVQMYI